MKFLQTVPDQPGCGTLDCVITDVAVYTLPWAPPLESMSMLKVWAGVTYALVETVEARGSINEAALKIE